MIFFYQKRTNILYKHLSYEIKVLPLVRTFKKVIIIYRNYMEQMEISINTFVSSIIIFLNDMEAAELFDYLKKIENYLLKRFSYMKFSIE